MDTATALERARKLIALATNAGASENEARNAALAAVRIVAEHNLLSAPAPERQNIDDMFRRARERWREAEPPRPSPPPRSSADGQRMRARYPGMCSRCGKRFAAGAEIIFDGRARHPGC